MRNQVIIPVIGSQSHIKVALRATSYSKECFDVAVLTDAGDGVWRCNGNYLGRDLSLADATLKATMFVQALSL